MATPSDVLEYWFGEMTDGMSQGNRMQLWYAGGEAVDKEIKEKFGGLLEEIGSGGKGDWAETAEGRLAAIIVVDQFSRNVHRGDGKAFAYDGVGLKLCLEGIKKGDDKALNLQQRSFFYHPLEHSESLDDQKQCVAAFAELLAEFQAHTPPNPAKIKFIEAGFGYAKRHLTLIERFGRFPHRNKVLGREDTKEEAEYLAGDAERFGQ